MKPMADRMAEHFEGGVREVGVLLIAFTPLDFLLAHRKPEVLPYLLLFMCLGSSLFLSAVISEHEREKEQVPKWLLISRRIGVCLFVVALVAAWYSGWEKPNAG